jgi:protein phosphatase
MLTQYLGMDPSEFEFCPSHTELPADSGTTFLLCSDGLTDMVSEERILEVLDSGSTPSESVHILKDEALSNGGRDNITIIVVSLQ